MRKEEKDSIIEYMMKNCGDSYRNALMKFEKWANDRIKNSKRKRKVGEGKKLTTDQVKTMVIYLYKNGYTHSWIAESMGISIIDVGFFINEHRRMIENKNLS
jgi:predicted polyphosphate/ATP-dependent NAD kinase